jgi:type I restriction enzyme S subunit
MIPKGWSLKVLEEICSKPISYGIVQTGLPVINGIPCVRVVDLTKKEINVLGMITTSEEVHQAYKKTILEKDELMMALRGDIGLVRLVSDELAGANITRGIARLAPKEDLINSGFLLWAMRSSQVKSDLIRKAGGSALQEISLTALRKIKIATPPLPEQRKIAQILSTWDKSIATTEKLIAASQQQKKALMQQLLTGKKRFAGFSEEWKEVKLKQLGEVVSGGTPSTTNSDYWDGDVFWVTPTDITKLKSHYIGSSIRKISKSGLLSCSAKLVPKGSLLVCTRATIGTLAITKTEMCTNQGFKNLVPNKSTDVEFLYYLLAHERHQLISKASGSTFLELSKKDFDNIRLKVPSFKEQQKIAAVLTAADQEIDALQSKLAHFKEEKKALMQQLLTGKRRVVLEAETSL